MMKQLITITAALAFAGTATADDMAKKAPDMAKKAPDMAKKEAPKDAKKDAPKDVKKDAPKMEAPKPAQEVVDMAKGMSGNWNCTGKFTMDGTKWTDFKSTAKMTTDLDKFWIKGESTMTAGPMKMKHVEYMTYDTTQKKWFRLAVDSTGGHESMWSSDGKAWEGEMVGMGMSMKTKTKFDQVSPKEFKVTSEMSMDGKKFTPGFEMGCKK